MNVPERGWMYFLEKERLSVFPMYGKISRDLEFPSSIPFSLLSEDKISHRFLPSEALQSRVQSRPILSVEEYCLWLIKPVVAILTLPWKPPSHTLLWTCAHGTVSLRCLPSHPTDSSSPSWWPNQSNPYTFFRAYLRVLMSPKCTELACDR